LRFTDNTSLWFVQDRKHCYDITVLGLANELGQDTDIVEGALCVGETHRTVQKVDGTRFARVVPDVLRTRYGMQIEVDADTVFACPLNGEEEVTIDCSDCYKS
jgi:hypothetical protein